MKKPVLTDEQREILKARFAETRTAELAQELGVSYRTLCRWAAEMGLEKSRDFRQGMSAVATSKNEKLHVKRKCDSWKRDNDAKKTFLRLHFATTPNMVLAKALGVNDRTIRRWAQELGLRKDRETIELHRRVSMGPTPEHWFFTVATIRELYPDGRDGEAAERTGYSVNTIREIARKYGFKRSEAYMQAARDAAARRMRERLLGKRKPRTLEMERVIRETFADTPSPEIAERLGISVVYVHVLAARLGLRKSREFVHNVRSTQKKKYWNKKNIH